MERKIKTRVWDRFNECFWHSDKFESNLKFYKAMAELEDAGNILEAEQQYTGMNDGVGGVDVYEGDIIENCDTLVIFNYN